MKFLQRVLVFFVIFHVATTSAGIIGVSGNAEVLPIPTDLTSGAVESDSLVHGFNERQVESFPESNVTLIVTDAIYGSTIDAGTVPDNSPSRLNAGIYSSHIIHFDPLGSESGSQIANAVFTFDETIIALVFKDLVLASTDVTFGAPGTTYGSRSTGDNDFFTVVDANTFRIDQLRVGLANSFDEIRVVTRPTGVPGPSSFFLILPALFLLRRRINRQLD